MVSPGKTNKRPHLGEFELLVLAAIARLGAESYGVRIRQEISEKTGRDVSVGTLYKTLKRLEVKNFVSSSMGPATPVRGGKAKTFYAVDAAGLEALRSSITNLQSLLAGVDLSWDPA